MLRYIKCINITILGGYGYGDSPDTGMSIVATADGDPDLAERMAGNLAADLWRRREELLRVRPIVPIDEGVEMAMARDEGPVLLVDLGDDPGSACPADSPAVLESLMRLDARDCALTIRDPEVVQAAMSAGVGATQLVLAFTDICEVNLLAASIAKRMGAARTVARRCPPACPRAATWAG